MRIIIAGAGDVGFHLAKLLTYEGHDISIIDTDRDKLNYAGNHLDVQTIYGNSTSYSTLNQANIAKADLLISVTSSQETNLTTCILGKKLGAKKTVARVSNTEYLEQREALQLTELGIDELISPELLAALEIKRLLKESALTDFHLFDKGKLSLIGVKIDASSLLVNKTIAESAPLNPDNNFIPVAILRNNNTIIPRSDTHFRVHDHAYFVAQSDGIDRVLELANKKRFDIKNVLIMGGTPVGYHTARLLSKKYRVKLFETDRDRCHELNELLPDTLIINADARDMDVLKDENLSEMDAVIAVTRNSETNIISSLVAKNNGVKKAIALVENIDYIHLSQNIGVDTLINKKLIAANSIFKYLRKGEVLSLASIHGADVEVLEFEVYEKSKICGKMLKDVGFPKSSIVGGVVRNEKGFTVNGDFEFRPKDHVVVLSRPECIHKVESFFKYL
jgi:trk system potassium uptake protein